MMEAKLNPDTSIYLDAYGWTRVVRALEMLHDAFCISHGSQDCVVSNDPYRTIVSGMWYAGIHRTDGVLTNHEGAYWKDYREKG